MRRHYLFVLDYYHPHLGGVEILFQQHAEALAEAGHEVTVVTMRVPGSSRREVHNGVRIVRVPVPPLGGRYLFSLFAIPYVVACAASAQLIHTSTYAAAFPAWVASLVWSVPAVITVHEVFGPQWTSLRGLNPRLGAMFRLYERAILALPFRHFLCDSDFTRTRLERFARVPRHRTSVVYPAVDYHFWNPDAHRPRYTLKAELGLPADSKVYLYFGRPGVSKGVDNLLDAAEIIRSECPDSRLLMLLAANPAAQHASVRQRVENTGLRQHVILHCSVPRAELPGYLLAADCVVIPSVSEGFGYTAVEAASIGCRVLATAGHSVEEVVGEWIDLVPNHNSALLAEAIVRSINEPREVRPAPAVYTLDRLLTGVVGIYHELLRR
jgi:D-inositol-3-phosphate glycosyltransferase